MIRQLRGVAAVILFFLLGVGYASIAGVERTANIQETREPYSGLALVARPITPLVPPLYQAPFHDPISGDSVRVYEDGIALTRGRSNMADIAELGDGRFSAWNGSVYFSPTLNGAAPPGKRYWSLRYRPLLVPWFWEAVGAAAAVWLMLLTPIILRAARFRVVRLLAGAACITIAGFLGFWRDDESTELRDRRMAEAGLAGVRLPGITNAIERPLSSTADRRLRRKKGEDDLQFATRLSQTLYRAGYICGENHGDSLLLTAYDYLWPDPAFSNQGRISITGRLACSYCGQHSGFAAVLLRRAGIDARPVGLKGHIVVEATIDGRTAYFDPMFGIGPLARQDTGADMASLAADAYASIPIGTFRSYSNLYANVNDSVEFLSPELLDRRVALEERLDQWERRLQLATFLVGLALVTSALPVGRIMRLIRRRFAVPRRTANGPGGVEAA